MLTVVGSPTVTFGAYTRRPAVKISSAQLIAHGASHRELRRGAEVVGPSRVALIDSQDVDGRSSCKDYPSRAR